MAALTQAVRSVIGSCACHGAPVSQAEEEASRKVLSTAYLQTVAVQHCALQCLAPSNYVLLETYLKCK